MPAHKPSVYQLKISLVGAQPPIWRSVLVDSMIMFRDLHRTIQLAMGWEVSHLHLFQLPSDVLIGDPAEDPDGMMNFVDEAMVSISSVLMEEGHQLRYEYDFGDSWEHDILLEMIHPGTETGNLPRCVEAARQCPPEDVGGLPGFYHFLDAMADTTHPEHDLVREWIGSDRFDPEFVDLEQINDNLANQDNLFAGGPLLSDGSDGGFCGLSPNQVHELLQNPLDCASVFRGGVDTQAASQALDSAPIIRLLKALFEALQDKGVRLTPKGNLPMRQVHAMIEAGGDAAMVSGYIGPVRSEEHAPRVHLARLLAELAGLTRKVKGRLMLKKATQARVQKGDWLPIYQKILSAALTQFNWAWQDHYDGLEDVQYIGPFGFWLLARYGDQWRPVDEYTNQMLRAFPFLPQTAFARPYAGPEEVAAWALKNRMIELYRLLGLLELNPEHPDFRRENEQMMRRTALFESLFRGECQ